MKRLIVLHTAECGEGANADKGIAAYLVKRGIPVTYVVDNDSYVQMLDIHAPCGAARGLPASDGIHLEHAGFARQTPEEWADDYSTAQLALSAKLTARAALDLNIPAVHVTGDAVKQGRGFCGHIDVTNAYGIKAGHWDPGPSFPWDHYMSMVALNMLAMSAGTAPPPPPPVTPPPPAPVPPDTVDALRALGVAIFATKLECATRPLRLGDGAGNGKTNFVKVVQMKLAPFGVAVDGEFGPKTEAWVKWYQAVSHITADGIVGAGTIGAMYP